MTITLGALVAAEPTLKRVLTLPHAFKTIYHITKLFVDVEKELDIYRTQHQALVRAHGAERDATPDEQAAGSPPRILAVHPEQMGAFFEKLHELHAVDVTLDKWLLTPDVLAAVELTGVEMLSLLPLMEG